MKNRTIFYLLIIFSILLLIFVSVGIITNHRNTQTVKIYYETQVKRNPKTGRMLDTEPFEFKSKKDKAILLVHGLTGSPYEMRELGRYLAKKGFDCYGILLPGHGTSPTNLAKKKYEEWLETVEKKLTRLKSEYKQVYLVGLCVGGELAALAASHNNVDGLVMMAPILFLKDDSKELLVPIVEFITPYYSYYKGKTEEEIKSEERNEAYRYMPYASLRQLFKLNRKLRSNLNNIHCPILVISGRLDDLPQEKTVPFIMKNVGSKVKKAMVLEKSGHVVTEGPEKKVVFEEVERFLR